MDLNTFVTSNNGKPLDFDNKYGNQCVDLFRFYVQDVLALPQPRGVNGAKDFWANYESDPNLYNNYDKIPNTHEFIPVAGDVMIWKHGDYGHIAVVISDKNTTEYFYVFSQNDPLGTLCRVVKYSYKNVCGVLRPKKGTMPNMYRGYDLANPESMKVAVDEMLKKINGEYVSKADLDVAVQLAKQSSWDYIQQLEKQLQECNENADPINPKPIELNEFTIVNGNRFVLDAVAIDSNGQPSALYKKEKE